MRNKLQLSPRSQLQKKHNVGMVITAFNLTNSNAIPLVERYFFPYFLRNCERSLKLFHRISF